MKITKRQLQRIIREEKGNLLNEAKFGSVGLGFQGWNANQKPDFAKAYGKDARVIRDFGSNQSMQNKVKESRSRNRLNNLAYGSVETIEDLLLQWESLVDSDRPDPRADDVYDLLFSLRERLYAVLENRE